MNRQMKPTQEVQHEMISDSTTSFCKTLNIYGEVILLSTKIMVVAQLLSVKIKQRILIWKVVICTV